MSESDQKQTLQSVRPMSAISPKSRHSRASLEGPLCAKSGHFRSDVPMSLRASVLFSTENSEEDYRDHEQHNKIHLPCCSESNLIRNSHNALLRARVLISSGVGGSSSSRS